MIEYDVTKLPFTSISRENWQMLLELDKDSLYDVIQHIGNYVMSGECNCETTLSRVVCGQVISVIDRRGKGYWERTKHLKQGKEQQAEKVPVSESEPEPVQEPVQEPQPVQEPTVDDDELFEDFFGDKAMDYSSLMTNVSYFKQRKKDELNTLIQRLGRRYSGDQIIQILQDKYLERMNI